MAAGLYLIPVSLGPAGTGLTTPPTSPRGRSLGYFVVENAKTAGPNSSASSTPASCATSTFANCPENPAQPTSTPCSPRSWPARTPG